MSRIRRAIEPYKQQIADLERDLRKEKAAHEMTRTMLEALTLEVVDDVKKAVCAVAEVGHNAALPPDLAAKLIIGEPAVSRLVDFDWDVVIRSQPRWSSRFTREITG
jgi:hypothetical protein